MPQQRPSWPWLKERRWQGAWRPAAVLSAAFLWCYAYYAALPIAGEGAASWMLSAVLAAIYVALLELGRGVRYEFRLTLRDALAGAAYFCLCVGFGWREVHDALAGAQLTEVQIALQQALRAVQADVVQPNSFGAVKLDQVPFSWILRFAHTWCLGTFALLAYWCYSVKSRWQRCLLGAVVFVALRWATTTLIPYGDGQPPLRFAPAGLMAVLLGVKAEAFRLPGLAVLAAVQVWLMRQWKPMLGGATAWLAAAAFGTAPLLWHIASLPDAALWPALALMLVCWCDITAAARPLQADDYHRMYCAVALLAMGHEAALVAALPLLWWQLKGWYQTTPRLGFSSVSVTWVPLLLPLPWLTANMIGFTLGGMPSASEVLSSLEAVVHHWRGPWLLFVVLGLVTWERRSRVALILGLLLLCCLPAASRGLATTQLAFGLAAASIGLMTALAGVRWAGQRLQLRSQMALQRTTIVLIILVNTLMYQRLHDVEGPLEGEIYAERARNGTVHSLAETSFAYDRALAEIKDLGLERGLYIDMARYSALPQVFAGYSLGAVRSSEKLAPLAAESDPQLLDQTPQVASVLFADRSFIKTKAAVAYLQNRGWQLKGAYSHYGLQDNTLYLMTRPTHAL